VTIFLTSDWRLSLTGLLVQYVLVGLALTRFIQVEVAIVKILAGVLAVSILYLSARRVQEAQGTQAPAREDSRFLGLHVEWGGGPLGLPLRLLVVFLVILALVRFFDEFRQLLPVLIGDIPIIPPDIAFVALWLAAIGLVGLVLSGAPLRAAPAVLTILAGFDLIYAALERDLAVAGLWGALVLMASLAFSYLITARGLGVTLDRPVPEAKPFVGQQSPGLAEEEVEGRA